MIKEIKDELCRIGGKVGREELFELSPVYLLSDSSENGSYLHYFIDDLCHELETKEIFSSESHIFLGLFLAYNSREGQSGLYDESGTFKTSLEKWLSYVSMRHHYDNGIIMVDVRNFQDITPECLWWKQFFRDIRKYKNDFLFFVSCGESDATEIHHLLEKEVFTVRYDLTGFTTDDYFTWFIARSENYSVSLDNSGRKKLKKLLTKYERDLSCHILDLWLKSLLWNYYSVCNGLNGENPPDILPLKYLSEDSLVQTIDRCKNNKKSSGIGFISE